MNPRLIAILIVQSVGALIGKLYVDTVSSASTGYYTENVSRPMYFSGRKVTNTYWHPSGEYWIWRSKSYSWGTSGYDRWVVMKGGYAAYTKLFACYRDTPSQYCDMSFAYANTGQTFPSLSFYKWSDDSYWGKVKNSTSTTGSQGFWKRVGCNFAGTLTLQITNKISSSFTLTKTLKAEFDVGMKLGGEMSSAYESSSSKGTTTKMSCSVYPMHPGVAWVGGCMWQWHLKLPGYVSSKLTTIDWQTSDTTCTYSQAKPLCPPTGQIFLNGSCGLIPAMAKEDAAELGIGISENSQSELGIGISENSQSVDGTSIYIVVAMVFCGVFAVLIATRISTWQSRHVAFVDADDALLA